MKLKQANPQGKGLASAAGFLTALNEQAIVPAKNIQQISGDLFTSLFILHSDFQFKPVIDKTYWLYESNSKFRLSLISPDEWKDSSFGNPIGCCKLHSDLTWTLELTDSAQNDKNFISMIEKRKSDFDQQLQSAEKIIDILPGYQKHLPFYQRAFTTALTHSLKISMYKAGIATLTHQAATKHISDGRYEDLSMV